MVVIALDHAREARFQLHRRAAAGKLPAAEILEPRLGALQAVHAPQLATRVAHRRGLWPEHRLRAADPHIAAEHTREAA